MDIRRYLRAVLLCFVPATLLLGALIYYPRPAPSAIDMGIAVRASCSAIPAVELYMQVLDDTAYELYLQFKSADMPGCARVQIVAPRASSAFEEEKNVTEPTLDALRQSVRPLRIRSIATNGLGQPVLDVAPEALGSDPLIRIRVAGVATDTFERFRILVPRAVGTGDEEPGLQAVPIALQGMLVPSAFDVLEVSPTPASSTRQMGVDIVSFTPAPLGELNVLVLSRARDLWKTIYNGFALAIAMSMVAAAFSSRLQASP